MGKRPKQTNSSSSREISPQKSSNSNQQHKNNNDDPPQLVAAASEDKATRTKPFLQEDFISALYKPHTITGLVVVIATIIYLAFFSNPERNSEGNIKMGLTVGIMVFLTYCFLQLRDGYLLRPHPAVWRVVLGCNIIYLVLMVFILFQNVDDARQWLRYLYPELGQPLPERSYAADCRLHTPEDPTSNYRNLMDTVNDEFILAHVIGYIGKAFLLRDVWLTWILSLFFEVLEITFQHWQENFKECWWDHIIVDVLVCNNIGIIIGLLFCHYFETKKYHWLAMPKIKHAGGKIWRAIAQFTPFEWTAYRWEAFASPKRFMYVLSVMLFVSVVDMNSFFLKYALWVPPRNMLNTYRLIFWFFVGIPSVREWYQYISDPKCKRLGANAWVSGAVLITESLVSIKFGQGLFTSPFPLYVTLLWICAAVFFSLWFVLFFATPKSSHRGLLNVVLGVLVVLWLAPFILMFVLGCPQLHWGCDTFYDIVEDYTPWICDYLTCSPRYCSS
eukprot:gb/GECH01003609.1/.p1 GENE.gb/GECH01003609.1/~~gb/GECH01003609.1/.p1  ORF type:complete len:502 (+),score=71.36 gb/GECH01003609.1/:1-1506(+)